MCRPILCPTLLRFPLLVAVLQGSSRWIPSESHSRAGRSAQRSSQAARTPLRRSTPARASHAPLCCGARARFDAGRKCYVAICKETRHSGQQNHGITNSSDSDKSRHFSGVDGYGEVSRLTSSVLILMPYTVTSLLLMFTRRVVVCVAPTINSNSVDKAVLGGEQHS